MARLMGDAIHDQVPALAAAGPFPVVGGYVTGSPDIKWTDQDWSGFPAAVHVTIDQGFTGSPVPTATVRDVEPGAWTAAHAVDRTGWTAPRPTIYCDRNELVTVLSLGWQGDLWLAIPGWQPGQLLPSTPGCAIVAVQNDFSNPAYDLSVVLDPAWPSIGDPMAQVQLQNDVSYCKLCGVFYYGAGTVSVCAGNTNGPHVPNDSGHGPQPFSILYAG